MSTFPLYVAGVLGAFWLLYWATCLLGDALVWLGNRLYPEDVDDGW